MEFSRRSMLSGLSLLSGVGTSALARDFNDLHKLFENAIEDGGVLDLPAADFMASKIEIARPLTIRGVPGRTRLLSADGQPILHLTGDGAISLSGIAFDGGGLGMDSALVIAEQAKHLSIDGCTFANSQGSGLRLEKCGGRLIGNIFSGISQTGLFARDSVGLEISSNSFSNIGNNGIQVWTSEPREDGTIISGNRISHVSANGGGTGQNGNGINIYRAGNVTVTGNRIVDCAFSAIRNNAGSNCQIANNSISRTGEVAIYCEFGFEGAVVSGNLLEDVALGISITNFNEGGRLATVSNNIIRRVSGGGSLDYTKAIGIGVEADTLVTGNIIEDAHEAGISMGWGTYSRNLSAIGNLVHNCGRGIAFSVSIGADAVMIANNRISGSSRGAIVGTDHGEARTPDLGSSGGERKHGLIAGNLIS